MKTGDDRPSQYGFSPKVSAEKRARWHGERMPWPANYSEDDGTHGPQSSLGPARVALPKLRTSGTKGRSD